MSAEQYFTIQIFGDRDSASELAGLLDEHRIASFVDDTGNFDPIFSNSELGKEYRVKVNRDDFNKANELLLQLASEQINRVEKDYYLFQFTDDELIEVVVKSDEWSKLDYLLALKLLKERGKEINQDLAASLRKQRFADLRKPEESHKAWIAAGYVIALMGGILGIFIGWHLASHKKTLPNGDSVYGYSASDREHGNRIFFLSIISMVLWVAGKLIYSALS